MMVCEYNAGAIELLQGWYVMMMMIINDLIYFAYLSRLSSNLRTHARGSGSDNPNNSFPLRISKDEMANADAESHVSINWFDSTTLSFNPEFLHNSQGVGGVFEVE